MPKEIRGSWVTFERIIWKHVFSLTLDVFLQILVRLAAMAIHTDVDLTPGIHLRLYEHDLPLRVGFGGKPNTGDSLSALFKDGLDSSSQLLSK